MKWQSLLKNKWFISTVLLCSLTAFMGYAQQRKKTAPRTQAKPPVQQSVSQEGSGLSPQAENELRMALTLTKKEPPDYLGASQRLFRMTRDPRFISQRIRIKYILGLMLYELGLYQVSAFQFVDVIRNGDPRFTKQSLQKLSMVADALNDDTLLNYAVGKVSLEDFPVENRDMLRFRFGEFFHRKKQYERAIDYLTKVSPVSPYFSKAKYLEGVSYVQRGDLNDAVRAFSTLINNRSPAGVNDANRVAGIIGLARVYYQAKKWDQALHYYRMVPRDTELWHDALFESSWAYLRGAEFRNVLGNLHSLHSAYYDDFFLPESILLRGIVYLYICQYDEMEKTLALFERIYQPVQNALEDFTHSATNSFSYYQEVEKSSKNPEERTGLKLPYLVARSIMREGDFKRTFNYIQQLREEQNIISRLPTGWRKASIGLYSNELLKGRIATSMKIAGEMARSHMIRMKDELSDHFEQYNFARYEMINGKKESLKKKIQGKGIVTKQINEEDDRDFYIQNGYEYWPFRGEYWLDEIGNYHYIGTQGCE